MALTLVENKAGIRRFDDAKIQAAVQRAIARSDEAKNKGAAVVAHADGEGVSLSIVFRRGDKWTVSAACFKPYQGKLSYGAEVVFTPF